MIAVIFEVEPHTAGKSEYLHMAAKLRPLLDKIDGFISIERFQSLSDNNKLLSLSFWRDETSVQAWKSNVLHQEAQHYGKSTLFKHFHIHIAKVERHYGS